MPSNQKKSVKQQEIANKKEQMSTQTAEALCRAVTNKDLNQLKSLINNNGDSILSSPQLGEGGELLLRLAVKVSTPEIVQYLIVQGARVYGHDDTGSTLIHLAADRDNLAIMTSLMKTFSGLQYHKNNRRETPLHIAAKAGHHKLVKFLIDCGTDPLAIDIQGWTALHYAAAGGHKHCVKLLLHYGQAAVRMADLQGNLPIHLATTHDHLEIVKKLLGFGDMLNARGLEGNTPLHLSCRDRLAAFAKYLLKQGAKAAVPNNKRAIPLHYAAGEGLVEIVELMLDDEQGALMNLMDDHKESPLHWACRNGRIDVIKRLIAKGADISIINDQGETPFGVLLNAPHSAEHIATLMKSDQAFAPQGETLWHLVVAHRLFDIADRLLKEFGVGIDTPDGEGKSALHRAAAGDEEALNYLLARNASVTLRDKDGNTALHFATRATKNIAKLVYALVAHGASISAMNSQDQFPIHWAAKNGNQWVTKFLLEADRNVQLGNKVDQEGMTSLLYAVQGGYLPIVNLLLDLGAADSGAVNAEGQNALHLAIQEGNQNIVESLLSKRVLGSDLAIKPDSAGMIPLHYAALAGSNEIVSLLLGDTNGASLSINARDKQLDTPLHKACLAGHVGVIRRLIGKGATLDAVNQQGKTPLQLLLEQPTGDQLIKKLVHKDRVFNKVDGSTLLHLAVKAGQVEVVRSLVEKGGAHSNVADWMGRTPLHLATAEQHFSIISFFLEREETDVNAADNQGETSLHKAAKNSDEAIIALLLRHGASPTVTNYNGQTPAQLAAEQAEGLPKRASEEESCYECIASLLDPARQEEAITHPSFSLFPTTSGASSLRAGVGRWLGWLAKYFSQRLMGQTLPQEETAWSSPAHGELEGSTATVTLQATHKQLASDRAWLSLGGQHKQTPDGAFPSSQGANYNSGHFQGFLRLLNLVLLKWTGCSAAPSTPVSEAARGDEWLQAVAAAERLEEAQRFLAATAGEESIVPDFDFFDLAQQLSRKLHAGQSKVATKLLEAAAQQLGCQAEIDGLSHHYLCEQANVPLFRQQQLSLSEMSGTSMPLQPVTAASANARASGEVAVMSFPVTEHVKVK